ncbi:phosphotransferase family protein [Haloarchaeobius sp. HRN-SO-5]|uniref:phosphotransferase family protein n=1 Tax=Haloarchaeobius sp. HRN-SO-5 TaxID=3446118 RepID=UPI003EB99142
MDSRIESVLADAFPGRTVADVSPAGISWNPVNESAKVDFDDGETVYLKVALDGDASRLGVEPPVVDYVDANCAVRAPTVVASETDAEAPYVATAPMAGECLVGPWGDADADERATMARRVGATLAELHDLRFDRHGHVVGGGADGLELDAAPWTDVLLDKIARMRARAPSERFDGYFDDVAAAVRANRDLLDDAPAALVHGDPAMPNTFYGEDRFGFVDWEIAHVGDPVRDVHRARDQQLDSLREPGDERLVAAFYDGYRERAGGLPDGYDERTPVYDAVRFLGTVGFFEQTAEYVDDPREEFATWVQSEMERRLDAL